MEVAAIGTFGVIITAFVTFVGQRASKQSEEARAISEQYNKLVDSLSSRVDDQGEEMKGLREEVQELREMLTTVNRKYDISTGHIRYLRRLIPKDQRPEVPVEIRADV